MSGRSPCRALVIALAMGGVACGRPDVSRSPAPAGSPALAAANRPLPGAAASSATTFAMSNAMTFASLVRDEKWDSAWRALEALPDAEKARAEIRYVRARVALARGDEASALPLLDGLEMMLPLLAGDVERCRAEVESRVGPFAQAGEWFAAHPAPASQLDAARAFEKAGDPHRARAAADRVIAADKKTRAQEGEARALRIRIASVAGEAERADARWLAVQGADLPSAADAVAVLEKIDPFHPLTADEVLARARALSDAGRTDDALHAIESIASAPDAGALPLWQRVRARAMTLYRARGRYNEAANALSECSRLGGPSASECSFLAARALSRADRDAEAIVAYESVVRKYPKTKWADQASFFAPYLRMLHGQWKECARGFASYLESHAAGEPSRDARSDGALCSLLAGNPKAARVAFEHLVEDEPDPLASARLANMAALAAFRDGDSAHAVMRWTSVVRSRPLSFPALVASARLAEIGAAVPPSIGEGREPSPEAEPPLAITMPPPADVLHELGLDQDAEVALRERESTLASEAGGRAPEALCTAYGQLGRARRRYQIAQSLPSALFATAPSPSTRWAWDCAYPAPYGEAVAMAEVSEKLPKGLLWAVMRQESGFDPDAVSPARAVGLMQLMPDTARPLAEELALPRDDAHLTSPTYAIRVGARALRRLLDRFHGNVPLAVAAYNGGPESVERWASRAPGMQIDTFVERIPFKETRDYVVRVMGNVARYGYLAAAEDGVPRLGLAL